MAAATTLSRLPAQRLKEYITETGSFSWEEPDRIEPIIASLCEEFDTERDLIMQAIRGRVPAALARSFERHPEHPCDYHMKVVASHLAKRIFLDPKDSLWVTHVIAFAMGFYPPVKQEKKADPAAGGADRSAASLLADPRAKIQMERVEARAQSQQAPLPPPQQRPPSGYPPPQFTALYREHASSLLAMPSIWPLAPAAPNEHMPESIIPEEVEQNRWCWSGFLGGIWWMWAHGMRIGLPIWLGLFVLTGFAGLWWLRPVFYLGLNIFLGLKGNTLAWQYRTFNSKEEFRAVQRAWVIFGIFWNLLQIFGMAWFIWTIVHFSGMHVGL